MAGEQQTFEAVLGEVLRLLDAEDGSATIL